MLLGRQVSLSAEHIPPGAVRSDEPKPALVHRHQLSTTTKRPHVVRRAANSARRLLWRPRVKRPINSHLRPFRRIAKARPYLLRRRRLLYLCRRRRLFSGRQPTPRADRETALPASRGAARRALPTKGAPGAQGARGPLPRACSLRLAVTPGAVRPLRSGRLPCVPPPPACEARGYLAWPARSSRSKIARTCRCNGGRGRPALHAPLPQGARGLPHTCAPFGRPADEPEGKVTHQPIMGAEPLHSRGDLPGLSRL